MYVHTVHDQRFHRQRENPRSLANNCRGGPVTHTHTRTSGDAATILPPRTVSPERSLLHVVAGRVSAFALDTTHSTMEHFAGWLGQAAIG